LTGINLAEFIFSRTNQFGNLAAFIAKDPDTGARNELSFKEFNLLVRKISGLLRAKFERPGFKVGLWGENRIEWCALAYATWHAGGTIVPLMHVATDTEIQNVIKAARLDCLFISPQLNKQGDFGVPAVFDMDLTERSQSERTTLGRWLAESRFGSAPVEALPVNDDDLAILIFTSGTTGNPKGVMLSHLNIRTNVIDTVDIIPGSKGDHIVSILPLSHMFEFVAGFTIAHVKGMCISYPESLKPDDVMKELSVHKANLMAAVPLFFEVIDRTIQEKLRQLPAFLQKIFAAIGPLVKRYPRLGKVVFGKVHRVFGGSIKYFASGGAKIDPAVIDRFQSLGFPMLQGYGLTETSPIISFTTYEDRLKTGSVGKIVPSVEIKIENPNAGGEGEICVKGPSVFKGYFENEEATRQVIKNGWFHTGDIGKLDRDGFLYITGRAKDIIVTPNGKNVYPEEVEEVLKKSTLFTEVTVLGLDQGRGETVHAVVVPSPALPAGREAQKQAVLREIERLSQELSDYKRVQDFTISPQELPKTATRKVRKHLLKEMIVRGQLGEKSSGLDSESGRSKLDRSSAPQAWLEQKLSEISKRPEIWLEAHLKHDLGMDSLTFMEIISSLEGHWNVAVPDHDLEKILTVKDLVDRIEDKTKTSPTAVASAGAKTPFDYRRNNSWSMNAIRWLLHGLVIRPFMCLFFRFRVEQGPVSLEQPGLVLTPNHSSHLDLLTILASIPLKRLNKTYAVAADDYFFDKKWKAFIVRVLFNAIPFERKARPEKGFKVCEDILRHGGSLVIFPEGTRSLSGELNKFKPGVGRLLASQHYSAVPAYIVGAYQAFPKGAMLPRPHAVRVAIGRPLKFESVPSDLPGYQRVAEELQSAVEGLRDGQSPDQKRPA
jgi:long-chain acyl-CoA synthetase